LRDWQIGRLADWQIGRLADWQITGLHCRQMATNTATPKTRQSHKRLKAKPKTEGKSWQTRNAARKEKQAAHAAAKAE
jgi:hypothetical protein